MFWKFKSWSEKQPQNHFTNFEMINASLRDKKQHTFLSSKCLWLLCSRLSFLPLSKLEHKLISLFCLTLNIWLQITLKLQNLWGKQQIPPNSGQVFSTLHVFLLLCAATALTVIIWPGRFQFKESLYDRMYDPYLNSDQFYPLVGAASACKEKNDFKNKSYPVCKNPGPCCRVWDFFLLLFLLWQHAKSLLSALTNWQSRLECCYNRGRTVNLPERCITCCCLLNSYALKTKPEMRGGKKHRPQLGSHVPHGTAGGADDTPKHQDGTRVPNFPFNLLKTPKRVTNTSTICCWFTEKMFAYIFWEKK